MVPPCGALPCPRQPFLAAMRAHGRSLFPSGNCFAGLGLVGPQGHRAIRAFARMPPTRGFAAAPQCARVGMRPQSGRAWDFQGVVSPPAQAGRRGLFGVGRARSPLLIPFSLSPRALGLPIGRPSGMINPPSTAPSPLPRPATQQPGRRFSQPVQADVVVSATHGPTPPGRDPQRGSAGRGALTRSLTRVQRECRGVGAASACGKARGSR